MFLEGIGREFLAHTRAIEYATRAVVDEGGSVDAALVGKTQHRIDALGFEQIYEFCPVISLSECLKYCPFGRLSEFLFGYLFLRQRKTFLDGGIACGLAEERSLERIAHLVAFIVRCRVDQPVILPSSYLSSRLFHMDVVERKQGAVFRPSTESSNGW